MEQLHWLKQFAAACLLIFPTLLLTTNITNAKTLKIATLSPEGSFWMNTMRDGAKEIQELTSSRVKVKFYPGGVMGSDATVLRKIRAGQLQGAAITGGSILPYYKGNLIYSLPATFNSYKEVDFVRERMDSTLLKGMAEKGFVAMGIAEGGFAYIMSKNKISSVSDLGQAKVWVPDTDPTSAEAAVAFGIQPISLPIGDVLPSLQSGLIDTVTVSPIGAIILQWHTQLNYITELPLFYLFATIVVDGKAFDKLSKEDQSVVRKVFRQQSQIMDTQNRIDNEKAMQALQSQNIKVIHPEPEEVSTWRTKANLFINKLQETKMLSATLIKQLNQHLVDYRDSLPTN